MRRVATNMSAVNTPQAKRYQPTAVSLAPSARAGVLIHLSKAKMPTNDSQNSPKEPNAVAPNVLPFLNSCRQAMTWATPP